MRDGGGSEGMAAKMDEGDGGDDCFIPLDLLIERERAFGNVLRKSRGRGVPFEQSLETLKSIFNEAETASKAVREAARKGARCNPASVSLPTEFPRSLPPVDIAHEMVGRGDQLLQLPKSLNAYDFVAPNHNVVAPNRPPHCRPNFSTSNSSIYVLDPLLERRKEMERRPQSGHQSHGDLGGLPISPTVAKGQPSRSNVVETKSKMMACDNSCLTQQVHYSPSSSSFQKVDLCCHLCQVQCLTTFNLQEHFQGRKHQEKCKGYEQLWPPHRQLVPLCCDICHVTFSSICNLHRHFQGKEHLNRCEEYDRKPLTSQQMATFYCDICNVSCPTDYHLYQHRQGKRHISKCEELSSDREKKIVWCDVCHTSCPNMTSLVQHRAGKRHRML